MSVRPKKMNTGGEKYSCHSVLLEFLAKKIDERYAFFRGVMGLVDRYAANCVLPAAAPSSYAA